MPDFKDHPLATYTKEFHQARDQLVAERNRQILLADDESLKVEDRALARAWALELASEIGHLDDANTAFLVGVFTGAFPPSEDVVKEIVKLNRELANVIIDANRPAVILGILRGFLEGAIAVVTGQVPAAPAPSPIPPSPPVPEGG